MKNTVSALMAAVSVVAFAAGANAFEYNPYVGISYNYADTNTSADNGYEPSFNSATVSLGSSYNKYFGTEIFYQISDNYGKKYTEEKLGTNFQAYGLDLYGYLPLGCDQIFSLVGTAGIAEYTFENKTTLNGENRTTDKDHGLGWRIGAGMQYSIDENWDFRAIARYVNFNKIEHADDMVEYSAGIKYNF